MTHLVILNNCQDAGKAVISLTEGTVKEEEPRLQ